jgi:SPP1 family predicted phage head-tail adaptor
MNDPRRLDQLITFQRRVETADGAGGVTRTWANVAVYPTVWAYVGPKSGREAMNEGRIEASYVVVFTVYNRADVDETCRILWNGVAYNIRGIQRASTAELMLRIEAERGVAE